VSVPRAADVVKRSACLLTLLLILATSFLPAQSLSDLKSGFANPPIEYHTVPSWWWDGGDQITPERLSWELDRLQSQGLDTVCLIHLAPFMLKPAYHTEAWWDVVRGLADDLSSRGMKLWISDGMAWGSPLINNTVLEEDASYGGQILAQTSQDCHGPADVLVEIPAGPEVIKILGAFAYPRASRGLDLERRQDLSNLIRGRELRWTAPAGDWTVVMFYSKPGYEQGQTNFATFQGPGRGKALDYMNPKATRRLLDVTLGEYERRLQGHIGKTVVATFQDELLTTLGFPPISPYFFPAFKEWKGYESLPYLVALFRDAGPLTPKIRCDYFDVWVRLVEESYFKPQFKWYEKRGMKVVHDQHGRGSLTLGVRLYGDYFRTMRWYQGPGADDWHEARPGRNLRDLKLASSIAHLYNRPRVFAEALHTAGWGLTMAQQRQVVNEEYVMGVNLYDEVGFNYTTHGSWFEWAPSVTMFRQPYFRHKRLFNDYVNRLSFLMSQGRHVCDVAVLYPVTSLQANMSAQGGNSKAELTESEYYQLTEKLFYGQIDFDIIDDESVLRADCSKGRLGVSGESYRILIVPPMTCIRRDTLAKIAQFHKGGGIVIGLSMLPTDSVEAGAEDGQVKQMVEAIFGPDPGPAGFGGRGGAAGKAFFLPDGFFQADRLIQENLPLDMVTPVSSLLANHRRVGNQDFYLIYNSSNQAVDGEVKLKTAGQPVLWDAETGKTEPLLSRRQEGDYTAVRLQLGPYEARLLSFSKEADLPSVQTDLDGVFIMHENDGWKLTGTTRSAGVKTATLDWKGVSHQASTEVPALPAQVQIAGPWRFSAEPTLDNKWGDFRLPVTEDNRIIGPEIREFSYRQETDEEDGEKLGWAAPGFDDAAWEKTVYTVGPYWWVLGPIPTRGGPGFFQTPLIAETKVDTKSTCRFNGREYAWHPYSFSQQFGIHKDIEYYRSFGVGHSIYVNNNFIDLGDMEDFALAYAYTHVFSPEAMNAMLETNAGGYMEPLRVWVNGEPVSDRYLVGPIGKMMVALKEGWNEILIKAMQFPAQGPKRFRFYVDLSPLDEAAAAPPGRTAPAGGPRLRWFTKPTPFRYDVTPSRAKRVGWYRFLLPPGTLKMKLDLEGKARAFVDGQEVPVSPGGAITLARPSDEGAVATLRIEQSQGRYAGAVFCAPIQVQIGEGRISLGDWAEKGLRTYSGVGVYRTEFQLPTVENNVTWELDLGDVKTTAEVVVNGRSLGARAWKPYKFDISPALRQGTNLLEVKVANTLANHGLVGTAWRFIYEGTEKSGLFGPVTLTPSRRLSLRVALN
jgi:hypothetical protein